MRIFTKLMAALALVAGVSSQVWAQMPTIQFSSETDDGKLQIEGATWYRLTLRDQIVRNAKNGETKIPVGAASSDTYADEYWFAFTGTVENLKVWNKAAGADAPLTSASAAGASNTGANTHPLFKTTPADGETTAWKASQVNDNNGALIANAFKLTRIGDNNDMLNLRDGYLAYWYGGSDQGSAFKIETVEEAWNTLPNPNDLRVGTIVPTEQYLTAYNTDNKTIEGLRNAQSLASNITEKRAIESGKYYRIQNYCRKRSTGNDVYAGNGGWLEYADALDLGNWSPQYNGCELLANDPDMSSANALWQINSTADGKYTLKHMNTGEYAGNNADLQETATPCTIYPQQAYAQYTITPNGKAPWHVSAPAGNGAGSLMHFDCGTNEGTASAWYIIEAKELEVTIPAEGFKAVNYPVNVVLPTGLTGYIVSAVSSSVVTLQTIASGTAIAAGQPFILGGNTGTYNLTISYEPLPTTFPDNKLVGTTLCESITSDQPTCTLTAGTGTMKFTKQTTGTLPQNSAYLDRTLNDSIGDTADLNTNGGVATDINEVTTATAKAVYFDLQGRRVANPTRGIYVKSTGEKVLILK